MPESLGSIFYDVDFRTKEVVNQVKNLDGQLDSLDSGFKKVDKTVSATTQSTQRLGTEVNKTTEGIRRAGRESEGAAGMLSRLGAAMAAYVTIQAAVNIIRTADAYGEMAERIQMATKDTAEYNEVQRRLLANANATYRPLAEAQELYVRTADTLRDMGYSTSQALDITDSLSLAFVRNAARGMRAESAISAVSKSLSTGKVAADQWESILAAVPTIIGDIAEASGRTTSEIRELGAAGKLTGDLLAEGLRKGHDANAQAAANMAVTVKDAYNNLINTLTVYIGTANEASGVTGKLAAAVELFTKGFRFTVGMLEPHEKLNDLMRERAKLIDSITQADGTWRENMPGQVKAREDLKKLETEIKAIQDERVRQLKAESDLLAKQGAGGGKPAATGPDPETKKALDDMRELAALTRLTGEERAKLAAIQKLGADATAEERAEAERLAVEIYRLTEGRKADTRSITEQAAEQKKAAAEAKKAQEEAARSAEQNATAIDDLARQLQFAGLAGQGLLQAQNLLGLNEYATPHQIAMVKELTAELYELQQAEANKQLLQQVDPEVAARTNFEKQIADLKTLNEAKLLEDQRYLDLKSQAETAYAEQQRVMQEEAFRRQSTANAMLIDSLNSLQSAGTNALTGLLTGASNGEQAIMSLAGSVLNHAVGALVEMGIQQVKSITMGQTAAAAAAAAGVATAGTLATAYAPAAAMASLASFGANAAPASAGITSTVALAQGLSIAGGRQYGGPVAADSMYRVNENGAPEVFNAANGRQYMLPNQRGEVVSNKDATASGGAAVEVYVNVQNNASSAGVNVQERDEDGRRVVDILINDLNTQGPASRAIERSFGIARQGR